MSRSLSLAALAATMLLGANGAAHAQQQSCDRACLRTMLDSYLEAVVANDTSKAPLAYGVRQTVNAINIVPGKDVWETVTALGNVQRKYFDPVSGQAAYYGTVMEGDAIGIVTVRVRVENRQITEGEWYIVREGAMGLGGPGTSVLHNPAYLEQNPPPQRVVPENERVDRDSLIRIAQSYFDAITSHDRTPALVHEGCGRAENGSPAPAGAFLPPAAPRAGGPGRAGGAPAGPPGGRAGGPPGGRAGGQAPGAAAQGGPPPGPAANDCLAGLQNFNLSMVAAIRHPLADVEQQAVLSYGVFIRRPGSPTPRNALSEWFFIDGGKIRTVYTAMFYPTPELAVPNWPPYDGNWPLPATIVPEPAQPRQ